MRFILSEDVAEINDGASSCQRIAELNRNCYTDSLEFDMTMAVSKSSEDAG